MLEDAAGFRWKQNPPDPRHRVALARPWRGANHDGESLGPHEADTREQVAAGAIPRGGSGRAGLLRPHPRRVAHPAREGGQIPAFTHHWDWGWVLGLRKEGRLATTGAGG